MILEIVNTMAVLDYDLVSLVEREPIVIHQTISRDADGKPSLFRLPIFLRIRGPTNLVEAFGGHGREAFVRCISSCYSIIKKMEITKSTVQIYKLRNPQTRNFADITIDENPNGGRISIASSFGDWSNYWGSCGEPFKKFLAGLDIYYAAGKFKCDNWLDVRVTTKICRDLILSSRRSYEISAETARLLFDEIKEIEGWREKEFVSAMYQQANLMRFFDFSPPVQKSVSPQFSSFWKEMWPPFIAKIQCETICLTV